MSLLISPKTTCTLHPYLAIYANLTECLCFNDDRLDPTRSRRIRRHAIRASRDCLSRERGWKVIKS